MKAPRSPQCGGHRQAPRPLRGAPSSRPLLLAPSSPRATRGARGVRLEAAEGRCPPRAVPPGGEASPTALRSPAGPTAGTEGNKRGRPGPAPARRLARGDRERAGPAPPSPAAPHLPAPAVRRLRGSQVVPPGPDLAAAAAGSSSRSSAAARGHAGTRPLGRPPPRRAAPSLRAVTARPPPSTRRAAWKERGPRAACPSPPLPSAPLGKAPLRRPSSARARAPLLLGRARAPPRPAAARPLPAPASRARRRPAPSCPPARSRPSRCAPPPPPFGLRLRLRPTTLRLSSTGRAVASFGRDGPACTAPRGGRGCAGNPGASAGRVGCWRAEREGRSKRAGHGLTGRAGRRTECSAACASSKGSTPFCCELDTRKIIVLL